MKKLLISIRNFLWYGRPRRITSDDYEYLESISDEPKLLITQVLLATVGLKVSDTNKLDGIYLTTVQRVVVDKVRAFGYEVGPG